MTMRGLSEKEDCGILWSPSTEKSEEKREPEGGRRAKKVPSFLAADTSLDCRAATY